MQEDEVTTALSERFNLAGFTDSLLNDLALLRTGKISIRDAKARADLAKQVLRAVHYVVTAQRFLSDNAKQLPSPDDHPKPKRERRRG